MPKLLIFAGTTEGRRLVEILSKEKTLEVFASVATEYGKALLPELISNVTIKSGRMFPEEMKQLLKTECFDLVIDTTHPYALLVTENIKEACEKTNTNYLRLLRSPTDLMKKKYRQIEADGTSKAAEESHFIFVKDTKEAAEYLNHTEGTVLLTTGSKELEAFTKVENYAQRLYPRVLPTPEVVAKCFELGYEGKNLICMQGPFSYAMNCVLLEQTKASYLVTKDSGKAGGFDEKYQAAMDQGVSIILIGRKNKEEGLSLQEVLLFLKERFHLEIDEADEKEIACDGKEENCVPAETQPNGWFPLFVNLAEKDVLVVGGGVIAKRRVSTLLDFACRITVIAEKAEPFFIEMQEEGRLRLEKKKFEELDITTPDLVIAATNDRAINEQITKICRRKHILVNVADTKAECDFYFPGIVREGELTVGITAGGRNHRLAKAATSALKTYLRAWEGSSVGLEDSKNEAEKN